MPYMRNSSLVRPIVRMIDVNRKLYMNEATGEKGSEYDSVRGFINGLVQEILQFI